MARARVNFTVICGECGAEQKFRSEPPYEDLCAVLCDKCDELIVVEWNSKEEYIPLQEFKKKL